MHDDPQLETFLRKFQPRHPAPLPRPGRRSVSRRRILAVAAAVVLAVGVWQWAPRPEAISELLPPASRGPTIVTLTGLIATEHGNDYESVLDEMDDGLLPDPTRPGGALRVLADVSRSYQGPWTGRTGWTR